MGIEPTCELLHPQQGFEDLYVHQYRKCFHLSTTIICESALNFKLFVKNQAENSA